ncbi:MAG: CvpA family protein [Terrimonas sp.]|nr:CvpA family protein [Terrimonas sp.]
MIIDLLLAILLVLAIVKGYRKGLIVAVFSILALIIGLAAAIKLSTVVASYIGKSVNISDKWLPVISFAAVFIVIVVLVRLVAGIIQKSAELVLLGWLNRLGGVLIYAALYLIIFSIFLFYAVELGVFKNETIHASVTYTYIRPWGPAVINTIGSLVPFFKGMFAELQAFFGNVSEQVSGL